MNTEERDKILARVRKILALSESNSNIHEAASAAAMAEKLMRKHQLSQAEVLIEELDDSDVEAVHVHNGTRTMPTWIDWISVGVGRANECETRRSGGVHTFYGVAGDAEVAAEMLRYLVNEVHRLARKFGGSRGETGAFRRGAGGELQDRLYALGRERRQEFQETSTGTALVVCKQALIRASEGKFKYKHARVREQEWSAHSQGVAAGAGISLSRQIGGQSQERIR